MLMNQTFSALLLSGLCLLLAAGCATKNIAVTKEPVAVTIKADQAGETPAAPGKPDKVVNAIAAIVNDEIVTLYEVDRESQPVIREAEKKATLDNAARSQIRRTVLERLVEKKLVDQKIKEMNIKVSDEEIRQSIDDVKKQNNMATQDALVSALASQGLTF